MRGIWKALAFLAVSAGVVLALSTFALALGAGPSPAPPAWKVRLGRTTWSGRLTALQPGARNDTERFAFTVTNTGSATQRLHSVTASISAAGGDAQTVAGADIRGCRAGWFRVAVDHLGRPLPLELRPGAAYTGRVDLDLRDSGTNQDACRHAAPAVLIAAR